MSGRGRGGAGRSPSAVSIAIVVLVVGFALGPALRQLWAYDTLVGVAAALLIVHLALSSLRRDESAKAPALLRFLGSRRMVALGLFSYSLYLIHEPILRVLAIGLHDVVASPILVMVLEAVIGVPLVVALAFAFSLVFERPFQSSSKAAVPAGSSGS